MKKIFSIGFILGSILNVAAQQTPVLEHYLVNPYFINPATAGLNGNNVYLDLHNQWQSFVGAPQTQVLTIDGNIKREKFGLGLTIMNDKVNIIGSTSAYLTYNYNIKLSESQRLRLGVSGGLYQNRIIFENIVADDASEMQIFSNNQNASNFDANAGLYYSYKNFAVGAAVNHLVPTSFYYENNFTSNQLTFSNIRHFVVNIQYDFHLKGGKWILQPSVLAKGVQGMPFVVEGAATATYKKMVWLTARYTHEIGYTVALGGKIVNSLTLAYSYGLSSNRIATQNHGTHEILLGYKLGKGAGGNSQLSDKDLKKMEADKAAMNERMDFLEKENQQIKDELEKQKELLKNGVYGLEELKKELEKEKEEREEMIKNSQFNPDNANKSNPNTAGKNSDGTDIPKDGNYYVVVGATRGIENAKKFQGILTREYELSTLVVRNSNDSWFLIYTLATSDVKAAQDELSRVKKLNTKDVYVGKPWIYTP